MHLLIVEDDIDLGQALLSALRPEGFTCLWVRSLAAAGALPGQDIDSVLLDLSLPDGNGIDLLRHWRARRATVPVIVITARSALEDGWRAWMVAPTTPSSTPLPWPRSSHACGPYTAELRSKPARPGPSAN
jgi:DNA-binding response OmpR family regulator